MNSQDLTQRIENGMQVYPGDPKVKINHSHATHEQDGYSITGLEFGSHTGTHIDAPSHTEPEGKSLDKIAIDKFRFSSVIVDVSDSVEGREPVTRNMFPETLPDCDMVVVKTGWSKYWGNDRYFDHPYLAPEAARWLSDEGCSVGIDCFSPDPTRTEPDSSNRLPAHHALLGEDLFILENLDNLENLAPRFVLHAYPLYIKGGDGSPVRAVAEWEEE